MARKKATGKASGKGPSKDAATAPKKILKITSIIVVIIFVIIIVVGVLRESYRHEATAMPTQAQVDTAKAAVTAALQSKGDDIANYQVAIDKRTKQIGKGQDAKKTLAILLSDNQTRQAFLVDADSGTILLHTETDFYDGMSGPRDGYREESDPCRTLSDAR